jgi:hypothetical protein
MNIRNKREIRREFYVRTKSRMYEEVWFNIQAKEDIILEEPEFSSVQIKREFPEKEKD